MGVEILLSDPHVNYIVTKRAFLFIAIFCVEKNANDFFSISWSKYKWSYSISQIECGIIEHRVSQNCFDEGCYSRDMNCSVVVNHYYISVTCCNMKQYKAEVLCQPLLWQKDQIMEIAVKQKWRMTSNVNVSLTVSPVLSCATHLCFM